jgi:integrase
VGSETKDNSVNKKETLMSPLKRSSLQTTHQGHQGSLGYQLLQVLKAIFRPGYSRHQAKHNGNAAIVINGKETMRKYTAQAFDFARFIKANYPDCRCPEDVEPEMCVAFIETLVARGVAGGTLGRYLAFIRKLDAALRHLGYVPEDAPLLLPTKVQGGAYSFRANTSTEGYSEEDGLRILEYVKTQGSKKYRDVAAQVIELMMATGLRIQEAAYLRVNNIDLELRQVRLEKNVSRTKGGKPRTAEFDDEFLDFMVQLKVISEQNVLDRGCIFRDRASLSGHVRAEIRRACLVLRIKPLGSHGFRKYNAQAKYVELRLQGADDESVRLQIAQHLGHNRIRVTKESYVPLERDCLSV